MGKKLRVLIVEDDLNDAELMAIQLRRAGFSPECRQAASEAEYLDQLLPDLDIILSDFRLPDFSGLKALKLLKERELEIPFILISGTIGEDTAVEALKEGAADYLLKDRLGRLGPAIEQAMEQSRLRRERKLAGTAVRESEERFRQLAENIQEVFWMRDPISQHFLYVSPAYQAIWGRPCAELYYSPESWTEVILPEDRQRVLQSMCNQAEGTYEEEYRILHRNGSIRWIHDRAFPVRDSEGNITRVVGVAREITERKQAESVLLESERRFREMLENLDLIAIIVDLQGTVTFCNDYLLKITGWSRQEIIGADGYSLLLPNPAEARQILIESVRTGQIPAHADFPIKTRTGELREVTWNNTVLRDATGNIIGTASIGADVTERNRAAERVEEQASMLNRAHDAIIVRDIPTRKITFWNLGAERLYGWTAEEAIGRDIGELILVEPSESELVTEKIIRTGETRGEFKHRTKSGKELIVSSHITLVSDKKGAPQSALVININITEQKILEAKLLRAQRMESIGTLASGVAHDLNNILAPIRMSVPMLRGDLNPEQTEEILSIIEMSAERGSEVIKQVLTFGRGMEGEKRPLSMEMLVEELIKIMRETFPKNLVIESSLEAGLWPVLGDWTQLHQVLLNLCVNARDAMPEGGKLRLKASNQEIDSAYASMIPEASTGTYLLLEVIDTGTGIPSNIVDRIYDPFFTTKGVGHGSGLGLSTVMGIVKSHGGFIHLKTEPGNGTNFQIYLPASPDHELHAGDEKNLVIPKANGELVLVVDDESNVREVARILLQRAGYRVLLASDGAEALTVFARNSASVAAVLTDLMMPFMDGIAFIRALRVINPGLPIIASTGLGEKTQTEQLKALNVDTILSKPYGAETLLRTMSQAIQAGSRS